MQELLEILDEGREQLLERVAAIDVAKASGMVCTRSGALGSSRRTTKVWEVSATTNAIMELADLLLSEQVEKVTVESTSDCWRCWFYLLEARGLPVQLVNAREVKNVPGRAKTDKLDPLWLAKLTERGMLRPSFVPPQEIRVLRDYTRLRTDLTVERTRYWNRLDGLLEDALIKITTVASRIDGVSVREMIEALIAGQRDPRVLAGMVRGRMRVKHVALVEAFTGRFDAHHGELARMLLDQIDALNTKIEKLTARLDELLHEIPAAGAPAGHDPDTPGADAGGLSALDRLDEIPGLAHRGAQVILAEVGLDMTRFPTPGHLVSWARLCPRTIQSGPVRRGGPTGRGNPYLKGVLGEAATAAAKTDTFLGERYRRLVKTPRQDESAGRDHPHHPRDQLAPAHRSERPLRRSRQRLPRQTPRHRTQNRDHIRALEALGFTVTITAAA